MSVLFHVSHAYISVGITLAVYRRNSMFKYMVVDDRIGRSRNGKLIQLFRSWRVNTLASKRSKLIENGAIVRKRRGIHKKTTCVLVSSSCGDFAETQERKVDLWPALADLAELSRTPFLGWRAA